VRRDGGDAVLNHFQGKGGERRRRSAFVAHVSSWTVVSAMPTLNGTESSSEVPQYNITLLTFCQANFIED
jgi:hypothetical protein